MHLADRREQWATSAEIEEGNEPSCGALDLEFDAEEEVAGTLSATSDEEVAHEWQACKHGIRSPPSRGHRLALDSGSFTFDTIGA